MPGLRCLAITSDAANIAELGFALESHAEVSSFTAVSSVAAAIDRITQSAVDALFVCLENLSPSELEALRLAPWQPAIVGLGDRPELAVKAFDLGAVDFLLKPVNRARVTRALQRLSRCACCTTPQHVSYRIAIQRGEEICFVDARDIHYIEADGDYTRVHTNAGVDNCRQSLSALEERLKGLGFFRIHRKWLVSWAKVETVSSQDGQLTVQVAGQQLQVARRAAADVRSRLQ